MVLRSRLLFLVVPLALAAAWIWFLDPIGSGSGVSSAGGPTANPDGPAAATGDPGVGDRRPSGGGAAVYSLTLVSGRDESAIDLAEVVWVLSDGEFVRRDVRGTSDDYVAHGAARHVGCIVRAPGHAVGLWSWSDARSREGSLVLDPSMDLVVEVRDLHGDAVTIATLSLVPLMRGESPSLDGARRARVEDLLLTPLRSAATGPGGPERGVVDDVVLEALSSSPADLEWALRWKSLTRGGRTDSRGVLRLADVPVGASVRVGVDVGGGWDFLLAGAHGASSAAGETFLGEGDDGLSPVFELEAARPALLVTESIEGWVIGRVPSDVWSEGVLQVNIRLRGSTELDPSGLTKWKDLGVADDLRADGEFAFQGVEPGPKKLTYLITTDADNVYVATRVFETLEGGVHDLGVVESRSTATSVHVLPSSDCGEGGAPPAAAPWSHPDEGESRVTAVLAGMGGVPRDASVFELVELVVGRTYRVIGLGSEGHYRLELSEVVTPPVLAEGARLETRSARAAVFSADQPEVATLCVPVQRYEDVELEVTGLEALDEVERGSARLGEFSCQVFPQGRHRDGVDLRAVDFELVRGVPVLRTEAVSVPVGIHEVRGRFSILVDASVGSDGPATRWQAFCGTLAVEPGTSGGYGLSSDRGCLVEGALLDSAGEPVAEELVTLGLAGDDPSEAPRYVFRATTDGLGRFRFDALCPGARYRLAGVEASFVASGSHTDLGALTVD